MRDVRDWNNYVALVGKVVSSGPALRDSVACQISPEEQGNESAMALAARCPAGEYEADGTERSARRGRGPRREETREELLARLLDPTITLEETARILEVCPTTVRRYTNKGILPHQRSAGNQRRFKLSTVLAFEARMRSGAAEEKTTDESAA